MQGKVNFGDLQRERAKKIGRMRTLRTLRTVTVGVVCGGLSYLLGRCPLLFDTRPLGLAILCASGKQVGYILAGLLLSGALDKQPVYICMYIFTALLRLCLSLLATREGFRRSTERLSAKLFGKALDRDDGDDTEESTQRRKIFGENTATRLLESLITSVITGSIVLFVGQFQVYDLFGLLFMTVAVPTAAYLYLLYIDSFSKGKLAEEQKITNESSQPAVIPQMSVKVAVGGAALMASITYSFRSFTLFGFKTAPLVAMLFVFAVCKRRGYLFGTGTGIIVGIACDAMSSPMFALAALLFAMLYKLSEIVALTAALIGSAAWCLYFGGVSGFISVFPSVALSAPLYVSVMKFINADLDVPEESISDSSDFAVAVVSENMLTASRNKMAALSDAFSSLSEIFFDLSDRFRRPQVLDLRHICDDACSRHCKNCHSHDICWGAGYSDTLDMVNKMASQLHTRGRVDAMLLPADIRIRCIHLDELVADVNRECAELTEALLKNDKTAIFAEDYEAIASMLDDALASDGTEYECDREASGKIFTYLSSHGVTVYGVVVCGKRSKHVMVRGAGFARSSAKTAEIREAVSSICNSKLSDPVFEVGSDCTVMMMSSKPSLTAEISHGSLVAERARVAVGGSNPCLSEDDGDSCCGDTTGKFNNDNLYLYTLISDGMGTGREAMFTSKICSVFLEKMLCAGNSTDVTLRMLNSFIRSKNSCTGSECSATVDLMELDLLTGSASFAKSGAAPTYIVRNGSVFILRSRTMPIGIIRAPDVCVTKSEIKPNDLIVMVSDGVTRNNDECPWLVSLLSDSAGCTVEELKEKILTSAAQSGSDDDISAVVVKVLAA